MLPIVRKVKNYIDKNNLIEGGERLLIACSGGADSVALVLILNDMKEQYGVEIGIVHTDHQLRGEESAEDMRFVEQLAKRLNLPFHAATLEVPSRVAAENGNVQVICREERYAFFANTMEQYKYDKLVVGHHADDQIESVIMSLVRGSISSSLTGIPKSRPFSIGQIIRPLLAITKVEIFDYINSLNQHFRHDPSNDKNTYTRNRFRHKIVPLFLEENPRVSETIQTFVEKQQQDEELLQELAKIKFEQLVTVDPSGTIFIETVQFSTVPIALQRRVVLLVLKYLYNDSDVRLSERMIESILSACNEQSGNILIHLPNAYFLIRHYNRVQFTSHYQIPELTGRVMIQENCWQEIGAGFSIYLTRDLTEAIEGERWFVQLDDGNLPLSVRQKADGDRIRVKGMDSPKKISRVFIDEKISSNERDVWPLLVDGNNGIIAVIGLRYEERFSKDYCSQNYILYIKRD